MNIGSATGCFFDQGVLQSRQQLRSLFENREIGREIRVENGAEADATQRRDHLARDQRAGRITEALAQRRANGRRRLHDHVVVGLVERAPNVLDLILFRDGAHRAHGGALAALHAGDRAQVVIERRANHRLETAVLWEQRADVLRLHAYTDATAALDALAAVADQRGRRGVDSLSGLFAVVAQFADAQLGRKRLKLAILVSVARLAIAVVLGKQEFDHGATGFAHAPRVGEHLHALGGRHRARGDEVSRAFDLDDAYPASADRLQPFDETHCRNADSGLFGRRENRGSFGHFNGDVVDRKRNHECVAPSAAFAGHRFP